MPWIDQLDSNLDAAATAIIGLAGAASAAWLPRLLESVDDLRHRSKAIRRAVTLVPEPGQRDEPVDPGFATLVSLPIPDENEERLLQINALRISILDLNEICDELTHNFWIALLSRGHDTADAPLAGSLLARSVIRRSLKKSCGNLISEGHGHLDTLRNSFTHLPLKAYTGKVIAQGSPRAGRPLVFEFALPEEQESDYSRLVFSPLAKLGERDGTGSGDFSTSLKRDLSAALFSSGRMAIDIAAAFTEKVRGLRNASPVASPTHSA